MDLKEIFHPKFFEVFNEDELKEIYEKSCCGGYSCYVIFNEKYFFELSADLGDELEIYCDECESNENGEILDKEEFFKRLRAYPLQEVKVIEVDA
jgi:hypothetical protein